ncbi:MAG TPA: hypothetical protein VGB17_11010 [Pyrinomonadaceae bacterium]|jgi:hypothetical protein
MRHHLIQRYNRLISLSLLAIMLLTATAATARKPLADKMKPEEVIAKHLDSIGTAEARAAARNRIINGAATLTGRQGIKGIAEGRALMASEGNKHLIAMTFNSPDIPEEKWAYNGKKLTTALQRASSTPSPLAQYWLGNEFFFTEGVIGGTLSAAWPLLDFTDKRAKLEYAGTDKINGRLAHKIKYTPRKGSSYKINMYFDAENFQHLRTQYDRSVAATMGATPMQSGGQLETRFRVTEDFSDFKAENGLTLPHTYKLELQIQSGSSPILLDWVFNLTQFTFNQTMTEKDFEIAR